VAARDEISGLGAKSDKPKLNPSLDFNQLKLTPTEGFILSRIDGRATYDEVCRMSSLGREETLAILRKLKTDKLILGPGETQTFLDALLEPVGDSGQRVHAALVHQNEQEIPHGAREFQDIGDAPDDGPLAVDGNRRGG